MQTALQLAKMPSKSINGSGRLVQMLKSGTKVEIFLPKKNHSYIEKVVTKPNGVKAVGTFDVSGHLLNTELKSRIGYFKLYPSPEGTSGVMQALDGGTNLLEITMFNKASGISRDTSFAFDRMTNTYYPKETLDKLKHYITCRSDAPTIQEIRKIFTA